MHVMISRGLFAAVAVFAVVSAGRGVTGMASSAKSLHDVAIERERSVGLDDGAIRAERLARVHRLIAAFNEHDADAVAAQLAGEATWSRGDGTSLRGRATVAAHLRQFFAAFPDASLSPRQVLAIGPDVVLVEWVLEATHLGEWRPPGRHQSIPATGRAVLFVGADLFGFDAAGEIEWDDARIDLATMLTQLGAAEGSTLEPARLHSLADRYTAAWGSQDAASVAAFFSPDGSLSVNGGPPVVGRRAIADVAQGFMTAFPDMEVIMDGLLTHADRAVYRWTLTGTNSGPGGTGQRVGVSGFEVWRLGPDGLIAESRGYFDSAAYQHQLEHGIEGARQ